MTSNLQYIKDNFLPELSKQLRDSGFKLSTTSEYRDVMEYCYFFPSKERDIKLIAGMFTDAIKDRFSSCSGTLYIRANSAREIPEGPKGTVITLRLKHED